MDKDLSCMGEDLNWLLRDISKDYIPQILDISDEQLGKDYLSNELLENIIDNDTNVICKLAFSQIGNKVIGFCLAFVVEPQDIASIIKVPERQISRALRDSEKIGVIKTIAVDNKYKGYGVGRKLAEDCYNELLRKKVQSLCSVAWKGKEKVNINGILTNLGFERYIEIPDYWSEDSLQKGYSCPNCGQPPCHCSAVIYTRSVGYEAGHK